MKSEQFHPLIQGDMEQVNAVIRTHLNTDVTLIRHVTEYIINTAATRVRPALVLMVARALGAEGPPQQALAAAIELIDASLALHHEVENVPNQDAGQQPPAENENAGNVLLGDLLYTGAFKLIVELDDLTVMRVLSDATNLIAEGEVMYRLACEAPDIDEQAYLRIVRIKTAKLFEAAAQCAALVAGAAPDIANAMAVFGQHLGTAYQVLCEATDYLREPRLPGEVRPATLTLPAILARRYGPGATSDAIFQTTLELAEQEVSLARAALQKLDDSEFKTMLAECAFLPHIEQRVHVTQ